MIKTIKSFDGIKIRYDIRKRKLPFLVFLHGIGGAITAWKPLLKYLSKKGFSTLTLDLRGFGFSEKPPKTKDFKIENFAKDLNKILEIEKIKKPIMIGHCFGGSILIKFSELYPNKSKAYVFIESYHRSPKILKKIFKNKIILDHLRKYLKKKFKNKFGKIITDYEKYKHSGEWNLIRIFHDVKNSSPRIYFSVLETLSQFEGSKILKNIKQPTLILWGKKDTVVPIKFGKEMNCLLKNSDFRIIKNENHLIILRKPEIIGSEIIKFIKSKKL